MGGSAWLRGLADRVAAAATTMTATTAAAVAVVVTVTVGVTAGASLGVVGPVATARADTQLCEQTLRQGASGDCVRRLQTRLNELELRAALVVDGAFGPRTRDAVEAFQARAELGVDGVVGPATRAALTDPGDVSLATISPEEVQDIIREVFPASQHTTAIRVARCESEFNEIAIGRFGSVRNYGIFQFNDGGTLQSYFDHPGEALYAHANIEAAYALYQDRGWQPWACA